jgi:hypothetical protein
MAGITKTHRAIAQMKKMRADLLMLINELEAETVQEDRPRVKKPFPRPRDMRK